MIFYKTPNKSTNSLWFKSFDILEVPQESLCVCVSVFLCIYVFLWNLSRVKDVKVNVYYTEPCFEKRKACTSRFGLFEQVAYFLDRASLQNFSQKQKNHTEGKDTRWCYSFISSTCHLLMQGRMQIQQLPNRDKGSSKQVRKRYIKRHSDKYQWEERTRLGQAFNALHSLVLLSHIKLIQHINRVKLHSTFPLKV